jgi:hypothetical protein
VSFELQSGGMDIPHMRVQIDENSATLTSFRSVAQGARGVPHRTAKKVRTVELADIV